MDRLFYVGRLGWLRPLPDVGAPATPSSRIGGAGASMYGSQWRDTLGYADSWTWKYENLLPPQMALVDSLTHGQVRGPLRLLDPRRINRIPRAQASGGSLSASTSGHAVTAGTLAYRDLFKIGPSPDTLPMSDRIKGCQEWTRTVTAATAAQLYLTGPEADGTWRAPVLTGETLRLSWWVAGTDGLAVSLRWAEYTRDDVGYGPYYSTQTTGVVVLSSSTWQELSLTCTPSAATPVTAGLNPRLYVDANAAAGTVWATAPQIATPDGLTLPPRVHGACKPAQPPGLWYPGGGSPRVVVDAGDGGYPAPGWYDAELTLTESVPTAA